MVGQVVEERVDVEVSGWVHARSGVALDLAVVTSAVQERLNLLDVGGPVDLGVCGTG